MVNWRGKGWGIKGRYWCWNFLNSLTKVFQVCKLPSIAINSLFDDGPRVFNMTQIWAICRPYNHPLTFKFSILEPVRGVQRSIRRGNVMLRNNILLQRQWLVQTSRHEPVAKELKGDFWFKLYLLVYLVWSKDGITFEFSPKQYASTDLLTTNSRFRWMPPQYPTRWLTI